MIAFSNRRRSACIACAMALTMTGACLAEIIGVAGGANPPPPSLGGYEMTPFEWDDRPLYEPVTDVPSPLGGQVDFSVPLLHKRIGYGWATWGHGYEGDVYETYEGEVTLYLPENTYAFYAYAEQYLTQPMEITATADDGTSITQVHESQGALMFGFYVDELTSDPIEHITMSCYGAQYIIIGEFGIAIPGPGAALALFGIGVIGPRRR